MECKKPTYSPDVGLSAGWGCLVSGRGFMLLYYSDIPARCGTLLLTVDIELQFTVGAVEDADILSIPMSY